MRLGILAYSVQRYKRFNLEIFTTCVYIEQIFDVFVFHFPLYIETDSLYC